MDKVCCSPSTFAFLIFDADHPEGLDSFLFDLLGKKLAKTSEVVLKVLLFHHWVKLVQSNAP